MEKQRETLLDILYSILFTALTASAVAYWSAGSFGIGFRAAAVLALPMFLILFAAYRWAGSGKTLAVILFLAFALRLAAGIAVPNLLPLYGHPDERREQLGYLFDDAYRRDSESWIAATEEKVSFTGAITRGYHNDQYYGMSVISVWIYKYLSPDTPRFTLVVMLGVFFSVIGLPFFWKALKERWNDRIALIGALIYALYPDAIFYGAAAMREPFLIGLLGIAFWALCGMRNALGKSILIWLLCAVACLPFSTLIAAALIAAGALWIWAEQLIARSRVWLWLGIGIGVLGILIAVITALPAFKEWIHYDIHTTENGSGWVEKVVGEIGGQFRSIFVAVYGITQPVLPAILVYPVTPACVLGVDKCTTIFWKIAGIFRAAGWYIIVPFLFYAVFSTVREKDRKAKTLLIVNAVFILVWIFISSLRAGGDQWDNPRYRVIFLPWLAFFCAWGIHFALEHKDWWLVRWIAIELIFLANFTVWYASRYSGNAIRRHPFWETVIRIVIECALVFATGLIKPIREKFRKIGD